MKVIKLIIMLRTLTNQNNKNYKRGESALSKIGGYANDLDIDIAVLLFVVPMI